MKKREQRKMHTTRVQVLKKGVQKIDEKTEVEKGKTP